MHFVLPVYVLVVAFDRVLGNAQLRRDFLVRRTEPACNCDRGFSDGKQLSGMVLYFHAKGQPSTKEPGSAQFSFFRCVRIVAFAAHDLYSSNNLANRDTRSTCKPFQ